MSVSLRKLGGTLFYFPYYSVILLITSTMLLSIRKGDSNNAYKYNRVCRRYG